MALLRGKWQPNYRKVHTAAHGVVGVPFSGKRPDGKYLAHWVEASVNKGWGWPVQPQPGLQASLLCPWSLHLQELPFQSQSASAASCGCRGRIFALPNLYSVAPTPTRAHKQGYLRAATPSTWAWRGTSLSKTPSSAPPRGAPDTRSLAPAWLQVHFVLSFLSTHHRSVKSLAFGFGKKSVVKLHS